MKNGGLGATAALAAILLLPTIADAASLEDELRGIASATQRQLPLKIDDELQATSINATGRLILARYHFLKKASAIANVNSLKRDLFRNTANSSCTHPEIEKLIGRGASWKYEYYDIDNRFVLGYVIDEVVCKSFR